MKRKLIYVIVAIFIAAPCLAGFGYTVIAAKRGAGGVSEYVLCAEVTSSLGITYGNDIVVRGNSCTTDATGGELTKICVRYEVVDSSVNGFKLVVSETSSGDPSSQNVVAQVAGTLTADTTGEYCVDVPGVQTLSGNTEYYVAIVTEDGDDRYSYTNSATGWSEWYGIEANYAGAFSDPMVAGYAETADRQWSVWAVYEH